MGCKRGNCNRGAIDAQAHTRVLLPVCHCLLCACSATNVVSGQAVAVVVATGDSAEIGHISKMVNTVGLTRVVGALAGLVVTLNLACAQHQPTCRCRNMSAWTIVIHSVLGVCLDALLLNTG